MRYKGFNEEKVILDQKKKLMKLENKILNKKENIYIKNKISKVKEKLEEEKFVLFSGCPCQAA